MDKYLLKGVAGLPSETAWSQTATVVTEDGVDVSFFVCLRIPEDVGLVDIAMIGLSVTEEMRQRVISGSDMNLMLWKELLRGVASGIGRGVSVELGIVALARDNICIATLGETVAMLWRKGDAHTILKNSKGEAAVVGKVLEGDVIGVFSSKLAHKEWRDASDVVESIEQIMHTQEAEGEAVITCTTTVVEGVASKPKFAVKMRPILVRGLVVGHPRLRMYVGVALLMLLFATIGVGMWRRNQQIQEQAWHELERNIVEVEAKAEDVAATDPEAARRILLEMTTRVEEYKRVAKRQYIAKAEVARQELVELTTAILKQNEVALTTWIEFDLVGISNYPKQLISNDKGVLYLSAEETLVGISMKDRSQVKSEVVGQSGGVNDWMVQSGVLYILNDEGIWVGKLGETITLEKKVEPDEAWQTPSRILGFGGSQYVLDLGTGEISKYVIDEDTVVASRKRWFGKGIVLDLSKIVDVVIDGDVWLLSSSGKLERYSRGVPASFAMDGYANDRGEKKFESPTAVATTEEEVFVLESGKQRVVVFGQDGKYLRQYINEGLGSATDLVVWEGQAYVLVGNEIKIFSVSVTP